MATQTRTGYLVIGDITGFTSYVATTELEHSQEILGELLSLILRQFQPILKLAKLEGDAVFAYAPGDSIARGETVMEIIEATYVAFRNRIEGIHRRTTCNCNACKAIPTLDLKFMLHFGDYVVRDVAGNMELIGTDVNLVHRLTKNSVKENTGWKAYSMFTIPALEAMGISADGMTLQKETYDHLGEIDTYNVNLRERYEAFVRDYQAFIDKEDADMIREVQITAPRSVVWEWLNDPAKRGKYMDGVDWSIGARSAGRTTIGATNHCAHGDNLLTIENILDWRPYDYFTCESYLHGDEEGEKQFMTYVITESVDEAGRPQSFVSLRFKATFPKPNPIKKFMMIQMMKIMNMGPSLETMKDLIEESLEGEELAIQIPEIKFPNVLPREEGGWS